MSTEKLSTQLSEEGTICVSTQKLYNPGEYREKVESVRVPKNCPDEYLKTLESVWVPENGRIRASTQKLSGRVSKNVRISVNIGKW